MPQPPTVAIDTLDLVNVLTERHEIPVEDHGRLLGIRTEQPLLAKLRASTAANLGRNASAAAPDERIPVNIGARDLYDRITATIRTWWTDTNRRDMGRPSPEVMLREWYIHAAYQPHAADRIASRTEIIQSWITQIRDLLDPPFRYSLDADCPLCGQAYAVAIVDGEPERSRALTVLERIPADDSITFCKACEAVWLGVTGARRLSIAIDERRRATP